MAEVILTNGMVALVDHTDLALVSRYKWGPKRKHGTVYARSTDTRSGNLYMHQLIVPCEPGFEPDHSDGNGLNNQRQNLRPVSHSTNIQNSRLLVSTNTSGFRGVKLSDNKRRWRATIMKDKRRYDLGTFDKAEDAALAYDEAARAIYGMSAKVNFPLFDASSSILEESEAVS